MILPTKHINFSNSLFGFGSYIISILDKPQSIDGLWKEYMQDYNQKIYPAKHSFDNFILTLIFLYNIGVIIEQQAIIKKCV